MVFPGNCVVGAVLLAVRFGTLRVRRERLHLFVGRVNGEWWHFRVVRDVLPHPLCYLIFWGRFERAW